MSFIENLEKKIVKVNKRHYHYKGRQYKVKE
jgi:hypothetical protein